MTLDTNDPLLTAYVLGELDDEQRQAVEQEIQNSPQLQSKVEAIRATAARLEKELQSEAIREAQTASSTAPTKKSRRWSFWKIAAVFLPILAVLSVTLLLAGTKLGYRMAQEPLGSSLISPETPFAGQVEIRDFQTGKKFVGGTDKTGFTSSFAGETPKLSDVPNAAAGNLKLIYNASIRVAVGKELADTFAANLEQAAVRLGGYVSESHASRQTGHEPFGQIIIRVPSAKLKELMNWVGGNVTVQTSQLSVQDITEQYVDMQARLDNLKVAETRLKELLAKETGKLEEVLKVEQEIREVRQQIEQLQGKQRLWDNQIALSTLTVNYSEAEVYLAAAPQTFFQRLSHAANGSWRVFTAAMAEIVLASTYVLPWLIVVGIIAMVGRIVCRGIVRKK